VQSLVAHDVFEVVDRPQDIPVVKGKWVLKIQRDAAGDVERYKARFCAKGLVQQLHVHYEDDGRPLRTTPHSNYSLHCPFNAHLLYATLMSNVLFSTAHSTNNYSWNNLKS
jgi:hypothetical protein